MAKRKRQMVTVMDWDEDANAYIASANRMTSQTAERQQSIGNGRYDRSRRRFCRRPWPSAAPGIEVKTYLLLLQEQFPAPSGYCYALRERQEEEGSGRWTCQGLIPMATAAQHVDACRADWVGLTYTAHEPPRSPQPTQPSPLQVIGPDYAAVLFFEDAPPSDAHEWMAFMAGKHQGGGAHHGEIRIQAREEQEAKSHKPGPLQEDRRNPKHLWRRLLREWGRRYPHMPRRQPGESTDRYRQRLYGFFNTLEGADCFVRNRFGGKAEAQADWDYAEKRKTVPNT